MSNNLDFTEEKGPVTCLGKTFANDDERRTYFTELLRQKLKDPEFRRIEGFPIGEDEDILALSDPPFYTACPNPWMGEFIEEWEQEKPAKPEGYKYHREPFAADVSEGKNDPIYNAHSYHTKVPHKAIMRYILHYTEPGDIVFDGFCGTGMTGVAAQMCGDKDTVLSLGYRVQDDGIILQETTDDEGKTIWTPFSKLGARKAVLNDLSPAATFIAYNYNTPVDLKHFKEQAERLLAKFEEKTKWMWNTLHSDGKTYGKINYVVWSDVYSCPECSKEIVYYKEAFKKTGKIVEFNPEFSCPHCSCLISKNPSKNSTAQKPTRIFENIYDPILKDVTKKQKQVASLLNYSIGTKRFEKRIDNDDIAKIKSIKIDDRQIPFLPHYAIIKGDKSADPFACGVSYVHQFYTNRNLYSLSILTELANRQPQLEFLIGSILPKLTIMNRFMPQHGGRALVGPMANTLYIPPVSVENNVIDQVQFQFRKIIQALTPLFGSVITTQAAQSLNNQECSMDYIFFDPPFGSNIMYSELSYIRESWLKILTNNKPEAIENNTQKKGVREYRELMTKSFKEAYRFLKPGRWMTVEFSNTKASIWNSIQSALTEAGFIISSMSALDKTRGGLHAMLGPTAVKQDLVISAYKPNGGFEERFIKEANTEDGVWDFIGTHLKYLAVTKKNGTDLIPVPEREPRILYDQLISYYFRKGYKIPLSSHEFQRGLAERFEERDGMFFLQSQVVEYDKARAKATGQVQLSLFVDDEKSAIDWLRDYLRKKPGTYSDIHPNFMQQMSANSWKAGEKQPELQDLLNMNFLRYDGKDEVPSQIHTYLSTNFKDLRNLDKNEETLIAKAKDRWYVPDPNKEADLEKVRVKSLLKEYATYSEGKGKLKEVRREALRTGFKHDYQSKNFANIMAIAKRLKPDIIDEDETLLMYYDYASMVVED